MLPLSSSAPTPTPPNAADAPSPRRWTSTSAPAWDAASDHNMGVRLEGGHLELNIKSADDAFARPFFLAAIASKH